MTPLFVIDEGATAAQALAALTAAGWRIIGVGDWSWVLASPDSDIVCRVTPIDPAYRMFAEACLARPPNRWAVIFHGLTPLRGGGYAVFMERLWPADPEAAAAFCALLGIACDSGYETTASRAVATRDEDLASLRDLIAELTARGAARYRLWGGSDVRPGNVMADALGYLKLVDPLFIRGRSIVEAITQGQADLLEDFSRSELEDFLTIPVFAPGSATDALRARLRSMFGD